MTKRYLQRICPGKARKKHECDKEVDQHTVGPKTVPQEGMTKRHLQRRCPGKTPTEVRAYLETLREGVCCTRRRNTPILRSKRRLSISTTLSINPLHPDPGAKSLTGSIKTSIMFISLVAALRCKSPADNDIRFDGEDFVAQPLLQGGVKESLEGSLHGLHGGSKRHLVTGIHGSREPGDRPPQN